VALASGSPAVEQVCDPARAATFMQVTGDRYRWEFRLLDGEDEAGLITPQARGRAGLWNVRPRAGEVAARALLPRRSGRSFTPTV